MLVRAAMTAILLAAASPAWAATPGPTADPATTNRSRPGTPHRAPRSPPHLSQTPPAVPAQPLGSAPPDVIAPH